ncbi:hypothetical protein H072_2172 [Dactylellina haptotyla CBS 200.50]|uniref:PB1 domain-containing protein n=1 Tax=Dactylellina haptotyla (strain CBS 200.50) TaxID=1284197 RepID=S8AS88_DACHA|nr:hypothetical protein H072_2172 [Dactylellina haptotyla CBS 200.50]
MELWVHALEHYDQGNFKGSLKTFIRCGGDAKTLFNMGMIHATLGEHEAALQAYKAALTKDPYFAIAYFQSGVSNYLLSNFQDALCDFTKALQFLRENLFINYEQLGLKFCMYRCEVLFNRGLCYANLMSEEKAVRNLTYASREKQSVAHHSVIDEALASKGEGFTVFSIPVGTIFRMSELKARHAEQREQFDRERKNSVSTSERTSTDSSGHGRGKSHDASESKIRKGSISSSKSGSVDETNKATPQRGIGTLGRGKLLSKRSFGTLRRKKSADSSSDDGKHSRSQSITKPRPPPIDSSLGLPSQSLPTAKASATSTEKTPRARPPVKSPFNGMGLPQRSLTQKSPRPQHLEESGHSRSQSHGLPQKSPMQPLTAKRTAGLPTNPTKWDALPQPQKTPRATPLHVPITPNNVHKGLPTIPSPQLIGGQFQQRQPEPQEKERKRKQASPTTSEQFFSGKETFYDDEGGESDDDIPDYYGSEWSGRSRSSWATSVDSYPEDPVETARKIRRRTVIQHLTKIKLKMHHEDDLVAIMIPPDIDFKEFARRVRDKLKMERNGKIKFKDDDGLHILLGDQEDLDQAIDTCERMAKKTGADFGKMEIWVS